MFGSRLKIAREEKNLTVKALGELIGKSDANISRYENGVHGPGRTVLAKLSEVLGVNPVWLMGSDSVSMYEPISNDNEFKIIPIINQLGKESIVQNNHIVSYVSTNEKVDFGFIVFDDSMIGARIYEGDIIHIKKTDQIEHGKIALVIYEDEPKIRTLLKIGNNLILHASNPNYEDVIIQKSKLKDIQILGIVKSVKFDIK